MRSRQMDHAIPPSPAPSFTSDHYLRHPTRSSPSQNDAFATLPRCSQTTPLGIVQVASRTASRYQTPEPSVIYHYPSPSMAYSQSNQGLPFDYPDDSGAYDIAHGTPAQQAYNLNTPEASPPTPSHRMSDNVNNRSASGTPRASQGSKVLGVKSGRIEKASSSKRKADVPASPPNVRKEKAAKSGGAASTSVIDEPLSVLTKDWEIPAVDIAAYVHRSAQERREEVDRGKIPGKVKRAMNAFMLYRKAYQDRAKKYAQQSNHQVVSKVCGQSWSMESEAVRRQFNDWALIERDNHRMAHPEYKFTPSKSRKKVKGEFDEDSDLDDGEWEGSSRLGTKYRATSRTSMDDQHAASYGSTYATPHIGDMATLQPPPFHHRSAPSHLSGLARHNPGPYETDGYASTGIAHYQQVPMGHHVHQHPQSHPHHFDGMAFTNPMHHNMALAAGRHPTENQGYAIAGQYPHHASVVVSPQPLGAGPSHLPPQIQRSSMGSLSQQIDPSLMARENMQQYDFSNPMVATGGLDDDRWPSGLPPVHEGTGLYTGPYLAAVDESFIQDSHLQYLRGDDESWKVGPINEGEEWHPLSET